MRRILVLIDHFDGQPRPVSLQALSAARRLEGEIAALWCGPGAADAAPTIAAHGASEIFHFDADTADALRAQVDILEAAVAEFSADTVLFGGEPDVVARFAVRADAGVVTDVVGFGDENGQISAFKDVLGGAWVTTSQIAEGRLGCFGVAANAFEALIDPAAVSGAVVMLRELDVALTDVDSSVSVPTRADGGDDGGRETLAEASVVVAGGRGVGSAESFGQLHTLAGLLGGAVGATRIAVEEGWAAHADVIGQNGHTVTPELYLAVGVSGAPEHVSGMRTAKRVVAINKDPHAPIFDQADFGIVGDAQVVVPRLIERLTQAQQ